jgi:hypothetical protein
MGCRYEKKGGSRQWHAWRFPVPQQGLIYVGQFGLVAVGVCADTRSLSPSVSCPRPFCSGTMR